MGKAMVDQDGQEQAPDVQEAEVDTAAVAERVRYYLKSNQIQWTRFGSLGEPRQVVHLAGQAQALAAAGAAGAGTLPEDAAVDGHQGHLWQQSLHEGEERKACCEQKKEDALH